MTIMSVFEEMESKGLERIVDEAREVVKCQLAAYMRCEPPLDLVELLTRNFVQSIPVLLSDEEE
jgi:hypothetical protein